MFRIQKMFLGELSFPEISWNCVKGLCRRVCSRKRREPSTPGRQTLSRKYEQLEPLGFMVSPEIIYSSISF